MIKGRFLGTFFVCRPPPQGYTETSTKKYHKPPGAILTRQELPPARGRTANSPSADTGVDHAVNHQHRQGSRRGQKPSSRARFISHTITCQLRPRGVHSTNVKEGAMKVVTRGIQCVCVWGGVYFGTRSFPPQKDASEFTLTGAFTRNVQTLR